MEFNLWYSKLLFIIVWPIVVFISLYLLRYVFIAYRLSQNCFYLPYIYNRYIKRHKTSYKQILSRSSALINKYQYIKTGDCISNDLKFSKEYTCKPILLKEIINYLETVKDLPENKLDEDLLNQFSHKLLAQLILQLFSSKFPNMWEHDEVAVLLYCTYVQVLKWAIKNNYTTEEEADNIKKDLLHSSHSFTWHMPY